jgi:long-chain acyl-CoA synthetase
MSSLLPLAQFLHWENVCPDRIYLNQPMQGGWKTWTWKQAGDEARKMAAQLVASGIQQGDHVALLSKNCAEWIMADLAIMMAGCVSIPIYPTLTAAAIGPIMTHSGSKAIFVGKLDDYEGQKEGIPAEVLHFTFDAYGLSHGIPWSQVQINQQPVNSVHDWKRRETFTIVYTSGTTGVPKGVMHGPDAFQTVLNVATKEVELPYEPALFSYLPLSHIAERMAIEMNSFYNKGTISFSESLETFAKNLAATQPHCFFAVPRIWGKFREGVLKKLPQKKLNLLLNIPLVNLYIKKTIRKNLGLSRASHIFSAAAPISIELLKWYESVGITVFQAYGMTEDCVYAHFCKPGQNKMGSVGKPLSGLQVKIADTGEILVKSSGNLMGYYKEEAITAEAFDEEGFFKTGDIGQYDVDGFLYLTGRVKDQFKTDKGKYISPSPIELMVLKNNLIEQVCVVGMGIPQPIALVNLSEEGKKANRDELVASISATLNEANLDLENYEKLMKLVIVKEDWGIENGFLTPTLKVKRNEVEKLKMAFYPDWYNYDGLVVWE